MKEISVIVPIYNVELYLRECLDSILKQTGVNFEIVCVDDGSTDTSQFILKEYARMDSRIKIYTHLHNMGHATTRNDGYRYAKGEYLYTIDSDDILVDGALHRMYTCVKDHNLDLLAFSAKAFLDKDYITEIWEENEYVRKREYPGIYNGPELFALLMKNNDRVIANRVLYCYKREFFLKNNLFDEEGLRYADDSMFSYYMAAKRVMCISDQLYLRRYRRGSTVTSPLKKIHLESLIILFEAEMNKWRTLKFRNEINQQIERYFDLRLKEIHRLQCLFQQEKSEEICLKEYPSDSYFCKRFIRQEPLYSECLSDEQIDKIRKSEFVILYGAGFIATEVARVLEYKAITDYVVAVTEPQDNKQLFRGRRIKKITNLTNLNKALVVVAVSKRNEKEIMKLLSDYGFHNIMWIVLN